MARSRRLRIYNPQMPTPPRARLLLGAALAALSLAAAGCGVEAKPTEQVTAPGDPAPAKQALRLYLDNDRCDLMSDRYAESLDPDPATARKLCAKGHVPVDMLVEHGQYRIKDAELIDGNGIIRIELKDGGIRDYTLTPGGPAKFQVDSVTSTFKAEYGQPLRLQAREDIDAEPVDARIIVEAPRRVRAKDLSEDEYTTGLDHYYLLPVRITSRSDKAQLLGSDGFQLATKDGQPIATPRDLFSDLGRPLPGVLQPGDTNVGDIFFSSPAQVDPGMVQFIYGAQLTGDKLVWTAPKK